MATPARPTVGKLTVPYVVDTSHDPVDFTMLDPEHVARCAVARRCGICGERIKGGPIAFIGPDDGRRCFADAWMHPRCAQVAMDQCPFLGGRDFRDPTDRDNPLQQPYNRVVQVLFLATDGRSHRDQLQHWHFEAVGLLWRQRRGGERRG